MKLSYNIHYHIFWLRWHMSLRFLQHQRIEDVDQWYWFQLDTSTLFWEEGCWLKNRWTKKWSYILYLLEYILSFGVRYPKKLRQHPYNRLYTLRNKNARTKVIKVTCKVVSVKWTCVSQTVGWTVGPWGISSTINEFRIYTPRRSMYEWTGSFW